MTVKELKDYLNSIKVDDNIEIYRTDNSGIKEPVDSVIIGKSDINNKIIMLFN